MAKTNKKTSAILVLDANAFYDDWLDIAEKNLKDEEGEDVEWGEGYNAPLYQFMVNMYAQDEMTEAMEASLKYIAEHVDVDMSFDDWHFVDHYGMLEGAILVKLNGTQAQFKKLRRYVGTIMDAVSKFEKDFEHIPMPVMVDMDLKIWDLNKNR